MPIVQRPAGDLTQGDILKGIPLFLTRTPWAPEPQANRAPFDFCVVVTRPCGIAHKKHITVAGIAKYPDTQPRSIDSFDKILDFITGARDGLASPDVFHLGHLPEIGEGRFCARLDALYQIEIPSKPDDMAKLLAERRVAALNIDFARALHVRLFNAFASLGFDDHRWPSDRDLEWLVTQGNRDIKAQEAAVLQIKADRIGKPVEGKAAEGKQVGEDKELSGAEKKLHELQEKVRPYEEEMNRRKSSRILPVVTDSPDAGAASTPEHG